MTYVLNCVLYLPTGHYDKINIFKGSPASAMCFQNILNELNLLPDDEVTKIAQFYFVILQPRYVLFVSVSLSQPIAQFFLCYTWYAFHFLNNYPFLSGLIHIRKLQRTWWMRLEHWAQSCLRDYWPRRSY